MLNSLQETLNSYKKGNMIILVDDENRENEGDLVVAAEFASPHIINFMARYGKGLICVPLIEERLKHLDIPNMVTDNQDPFRTAFTVSVDSAYGITTGISAYDRSKTIQVLIDPKSRPESLIRPGHIFPLKALKGGVLTRAGHTEASIDLCLLGGLYPASVICEIIKDNGKMARLKSLKKFAKKHNLFITSIEKLLHYKKNHSDYIKEISQINLPNPYGDFKLISYTDSVTGEIFLVFIFGDIQSSDFKKKPLVRIHSECFTGDIFKSYRCDCGDQLEMALAEIKKNKSGIFIYMKQEGRGIGILNKIKSYALQEKGYDTVEANHILGFPNDLRNYQAAASILNKLNIKEIQLLTNNPHKESSLKENGIHVIKRIALITKVRKENEKYLLTKKIKMHHFL